jgi:predicted ATPase
LSGALRIVKGFTAPETGDAYGRARERWEQLGCPTEFSHILYEQSSYHTYRGEFDRALRLDEDLLRLSCQRDDSTGLVLGHSSAGRNLFSIGDFASSRSHLEATVALYDPASHGPLIQKAIVDPHVNSLAFLGNALFCLGFTDQGLTRINAAIAEARRLTHPPSLAGSLAVGARMLSLIGASEILTEWVDELVAVTTKQGLPSWHTVGTFYLGWIKVKNNAVAEGMSLLRTSLATNRITRGAKWRPHFVVLLAEAWEIAGQIKKAITQVNNALQIAEETGERWAAAELNRYKGRLLLQQGHSEAAEELYQKALSIAREQQAKLWELRAAVSLARLRRDQGRDTEARDLLAPVYGWFIEGFDTPDLKEARLLLDELTQERE